MARGLFWLIALLPLVPGCSEKSHAPVVLPSEETAGVVRGDTVESRAAFYRQATAPVGGGGAGFPERAKLADGSEQAGPGDKKPESARKIIQTATVYLVIEHFEEGEKQLRQVIEQHGGRIAGSDTQGSAGSQRSGRWKVRVPVDRFEAFKQAVEKIGNLERSTVESREVTEEYYDTQARLKNKTVEEARLIQHLEKSTGKLSEILEVERELSRVRGEIEQLQGRMNLLENLTSLTTVDIFLREVKNYTPPTAATFGEEASRTLDASWGALVRTGKTSMLNLISVLPWLPVWVVLGVLLYRPLRWTWRRMKESNRPAYARAEAGV